MPLPIAGVIWAVFTFLIIPLVIRILYVLGVGFVTYTGVGALLGMIGDLFQSNLGVVPGELLQVIGLLNIDRAFTVIMSAVTIRATMRGLQAAGALPTINWNPAGGGA